MDSNLSGDKLRSPHVCWVFAQLVTFPIFGPGATLDWPSPSSLTRVHLPQRGRRDLAFCKLLVAHLLGSPSGGRYVPVGRCPAADRGGSRDAGTAAAVTERATRQRPAPIRVPPPSLIPKGGTRFGRGDRKARRKPPWHRRCHQETPGEGFLRKTVHRTIFLFSCAC